MARTCKRGFDYYPLDVDFYQDIRLRKLVRRQGCHGVAVYTLLLCYIYRDGYYMRWDDDLPFVCSEQLGEVDETRILSVINDCVEVGLFDADLYRTEHVLTSRGIQERYWQMCESTRRKNIIKEYCLVDLSGNNADSRTINADLCSNNADKCSNNATSIGINADSCSINADKLGNIPKIGSETPILEQKIGENRTISTQNVASGASDLCSNNGNKCNINSNKCGGNDDNSEFNPINSEFGTQSKVKKRKVKEKTDCVGKKETPPPSPPPSGGEGGVGLSLKEKLDLELRQMRSDADWRECLCRTEGVPDGDLTSWFGLFTSHCLSSGKSHVSVDDAKCHFTQWLMIQLQKRRNDGNNTSTRFLAAGDRRRRVDTVGTTANDYKASF
jgi:hypothetical protein